jgi:hypothetical protein
MTPRWRDRNMRRLIRDMGIVPRVELCMDDVIMYILAHRKCLERWALSITGSLCNDFIEVHGESA